MNGGDTCGRGAIRSEGAARTANVTDRGTAGVGSWAGTWSVQSHESAMNMVHIGNPDSNQKDLDGVFRAITRERAETVVVFMDPVLKV